MKNLTLALVFGILFIHSAQADFVSCAAECKRFNAHGECLYQSRCEMQGDCITSYNCEKFDAFGVCRFEGSRTGCRLNQCPPQPGNPFPPAPKPPLYCENRCQHFDVHGDCTYATHCEIKNDCATTTSCQRFDVFGQCTHESQNMVCSWN